MVTYTRLLCIVREDGQENLPGAYLHELYLAIYCPDVVRTVMQPLHSATCKCPSLSNATSNDFMCSHYV